HFVPALVELAFKLCDPFLGRVMGRMAETGGVIGEERSIWRKRLLLTNPRDGMVGQIGVEVIVRVIWRLNRFGTVEQGWMPLVGVTSNEAIKILETESGRPELERSCLARLPIRNVVVLAIPRRVPTILFEHFRHGPATLRHHSIVAGVTRAKLGDDAGGTSMVIAPSNQRRARRRAKRSSVKHVITEPSLG